jgi:hypothetical protein
VDSFHEPIAKSLNKVSCEQLPVHIYAAFKSQLSKHTLHLAFKVKTLYEYKGIRDDDLSFQENEIVTVQPFQDQDSEWWFGTSNATKEAGYFPRSYVQVINHGNAYIDLCSEFAYIV